VISQSESFPFKTRAKSVGYVMASVVLVTRGIDKKAAYHSDQLPSKLEIRLLYPMERGYYVPLLCSILHLTFFV